MIITILALACRQGGNVKVAYDTGKSISFPIALQSVLAVSTTGVNFGSTGRWFAASADTYGVTPAGMVIRTTCAEGETWISEVNYIVIGV